MKKKLCVNETSEIRNEKLDWYYAPVFIVFWVVLYYAVVETSINFLPTPLNINDEAKYPECFIAERAEKYLFELSKLGPRVVGSEANEIKAIEFLLDTVNQIKGNASDLYELEVDLQEASGSYIHWEMINMYQGIQNVVVKLKSKASTSTKYLLINSHFDTVPQSPGAGDDGTMVAVMLEVMRVLSKSKTPLIHPVVFLFNGAEENPLQASHAFITQHKWAKNVEALINLDAAGSGSKEILFQSGPNHPWLMKYYRENAPHPSANTFAEELFQAGLIPSDTDFRIFRDYGHVPGLDMAYYANGYVYHTKNDKFDIIPRGTFQNTGDNVIALARAIGNAYEMENTSKYEDGHTIFFDYLGWFLVFYTETEGFIINIIVSIGAILAVSTSIWLMMRYSKQNLVTISIKFGIIFAIHLLSIILAIGITLVLSLILDAVGLALSWFSNTWLLCGLYLCPAIFGMGILPAIYLHRTKGDCLSLRFKVKLFLHSHCILLALLTIILTAVGFRSAYTLMMGLLFYTASLIVNMIIMFHNKKILCIVPNIIFQIMPYMYYMYIGRIWILSIIPMEGRSGSVNNSDLKMAAIIVVFTVFFGGFLIPVLNLFRKTRTIFFSFLLITLLYIIFAVTPLGFPYRETTAVQRVSVVHIRRVFHNEDLSVRLNESLYFFHPEDRNIGIIKDTISHYSSADLMSGADECDKEMFCGLPLYNHRWSKDRESSLWTAAPDPQLTETPILELLDKTENDHERTVRYGFKLTGPDHMTIFINPLKNNELINWSFNDTLIKNKYDPPYFIYISYGKDSTPYSFYLEFKKSEGTSLFESCLNIGIGGYWIHQNMPKLPDFDNFLNLFPKWVYVDDRIASYESWIF